MRVQAVCDLCCAEVDKAWTYYTKDVVTKDHSYVAEDPEWAVCNTCDALIKAGDEVELITYAAQMQHLKAGRRLDVNDPESKQAVDFITSSVHGFLTHLDPDKEPTWESDAAAHLRANAHLSSKKFAALDVREKDFPMTFEFFDERTDEKLHHIDVPGPGGVEVPGFQGRPIRVRVTTATGHVAVTNSDGSSTFQPSKEN